MASNVEICNLALTMIGCDKIAALTDDNSRARACNAVFEMVRDNLLVEHPWNFAIKRADLARLAEVTESNWDYFYQLPTDYIRVIKMTYDDYEFAIEDGKLATDEESVTIQYIYRVTNPGSFSKSFSYALSFSIALHICYTLSHDLNLLGLLQKQWPLVLANAKATDSQEGTTQELMQDTWGDSRNGGTTDRYDRNYS